MVLKSKDLLGISDLNAAEIGHILNTADVFKAFESGADAVVLAGCRPEVDPYPAARDNVRKRMAHVQTLLDILGLDGRRLMVVEMPEQGLVEVEHIEALVGVVSELGPNPLR